MNNFSVFVFPSGYSVALLLHIAGALGMATMLALEWSGLWLIRSGATPERTMAVLRRFKSGRKRAFAFTLMTGMSGSYLMATQSGRVAWSVASVGSLILVIALTVALTGPRMKAIGRAHAPGRGLEAHSLRGLAGHPLLWISIHTRAAILAGIVVLKLVQPGPGGSLLTMGVAIIAGVLSVFPLSELIGKANVAMEVRK